MRTHRQPIIHRMRLFRRLQSWIGPALPVLIVCLWSTLMQASAVSAAATEETPVTLTGVLTVVHADDFDHHRSRFFYKLEELKSKHVYDLHFTQLPAASLTSGATVTVHGKARGRQVTVEANNPGNIETVSAAAAAVSGTQQTIVLVANFQDANVSCSMNTIRDIMFTDQNGHTINNLYQENSFGQISLNGDTYGPYPINYSTTSPCDYYAWAAAADAAAVADGINLSQYTRKIYVLPSQNSCGYIGLGTIGGNPSRSWIFRCDLDDVYGHEFGHNITAHHASTLTAEYGDTSDIMGYSGIGLRHFNAPHKDQMGWLGNGQVSTITTGGVYDIAPLATDPASTVAPQVLKISKPDTNDYYYLSYRRSTGFDSALSTTYRDRVNIHRYQGSGSTFTYFLDSLIDGETFNDPVNGFTVTQLGHYSNYATVQVTFDCSANAPTMALAPVNQSGAPGATRQYTVTVTNHDSNGCSPSTFGLFTSVPGSWTGSVSPSSLALQPGITSTATLSVTSAASASAADYTVQVDVSDASESLHSGTDSAIYKVLAPDTTPPTAPSNLAASASRRAIQLTWSASTDNVGVVGYSIWRNDGVNDDLIGNTSSTSYKDSSASSGVTYTYYVEAYDAAGNISAPSAPVTVTGGGGSGGGGKGGGGKGGKK